MKKKKHNSIDEVINYLKDYEYSTETEIMWDVWKYTRQVYVSGQNKKYADMIRRGLSKGYIGRGDNNIVKVRTKQDIGQSRWVYFVKKEGLEKLIKFKK
jgi:hypothetical protein